MTKKILIIEDEALVAFGLEDELSEGGFEITAVVGTFEDALDAINAKNIDGAVLDGNLHGKSSGPVAKKLKENAIPFVVVTGYSSGQLDDWLKDAPRLAKPYTKEDLINAVRSMLK